MTTYQRLKAENKELKRQLRILALEPDSVEANEIRMVIRFNEQVEEAMWFGDRPTDLSKVESVLSNEYISCDKLHEKFGNQIKTKQ